MALAPGQRLAHYDVLAPIGAGGMGEVFRARDTKLDREVAIKILPSSLARDPERLARFEREARVLASLNHPNIAAIYGLEETADGRALVMELVPGATLKRPLPLEAALAYFRQIAEALELAHDKGIVHRDLKPGNIMVTPDGVVKVLDFGLAAVGGGSSPGANPDDSPTLTMATHAGTILGTAAYMSPEQASGKSVDRRSDIWSYGVVLWEMLSGERLFAGETTSHTLAEVLKSPVDFNKLPAETPRAIRDLLKRCLDRDVKTRLRDIGEARIAIQRCLASDGQVASEPAPTVQAPSSARHGWIAAGLATLVAASFGFLAFRPQPVPVPEITRFEIHAPPGATLPLGTPAVSPDGRTIVFAALDKDQVNRLYVRTLDRIDARVLPGTDGARHPFFSPDGHSLGFHADGRIKRIDLAGGAPRVLALSGGPWHGTWGQESILFNIGQVPANGGAVTPLTINHPYFLSDGKRFLTRAETGDKIELANLESKDRMALLDIADTAAFVAPTPAGPAYMLYMRGASLMAHPFDEVAGKLAGEPAAIIEGIGRVANPPVTPALGVSRSGTLAFQQEATRPGVQRLAWVDRAGKVLSELPANLAGSEPTLSPDGKFAAVTRNSDTSTFNGDIWIMDLIRGTSSRRTFGKTSEANPAWLPGGRRVSFRRENQILSTDASGQGEELLVALKIPRVWDWSPDGKYLIAQSASGQLGLVAVSDGRVIDGAKPTLVGSANGQNRTAKFSPDGKYIAYASDESERVEVYVQATPPGVGRWQVSLNGGTAPRWRADGKELFFSAANTMMAVDVTLGASFSAGTPHELFKKEINGGYDVSADGKRFLVASDTNTDADVPIVVVQNWWAALRK